MDEWERRMRAAQYDAELQRQEGEYRRYGGMGWYLYFKIAWLLLSLGGLLTFAGVYGGVVGVLLVGVPMLLGRLDAAAQAMTFFWPLCLQARASSMATRMAWALSGAGMMPADFEN